MFNNETQCRQFKEFIEGIYTNLFVVLGARKEVSNGVLN